MEPRGTIHDTNSAGRYDLVIYDDGILGMHGTYVGVALRAAGAGAGGAGVAYAGAAGSGAAAGASYEARRTAKLLASGRDAVLASDERAFFIPRPDLTELRLRKRWSQHDLTVTTASEGSRTFDWKPALNNFKAVEQLLRDTFGPLFVRD